MPSLLPPPTSTRLATIVAHVDHGKTTLADTLISSNGIISPRLAGSIRYLDSHPEEQRRGITMKSSAIGLVHNYHEGGGGGGKKKEKEKMVIHLVDSPGHVDFSSAVTSSLLLCDSALVVIDAVEGMGARTHAIMREAYGNELTPLLVMNKVDRLCLDLALSPNESFLRLNMLLESVNAVAASLVAMDVADGKEGREEEWTFDPVKGNVVFVSALYGWGFGIVGLARSLYKGGIVAVKPGILRKYLWGDYKIVDGKKVVKWKNKGGDDDDENLCSFAEFGLKPLWDAYYGMKEAAAAVGLNGDLLLSSSSSSSSSQNTSKSTKITATTPGLALLLSSLQIASLSNETLPTTPSALQTLLDDTKSHSPFAILRLLLRLFRPIDTTVFDLICRHGPDPREATKQRRALQLRTITTNNQEEEDIDDDDDDYVKKTTENEVLRQSVKECSPTGPLIAHVTHFTALSSNDTIVGITRILSGTLHSNQPYLAYGPSSTTPHKCHVKCHLLMGTDLVPVQSVPAAHICAVEGLEDLQYRQLTLGPLSHPHGMTPLLGFSTHLKPLVKVNVEPKDVKDTPLLEKGLLKLALSDASVEITATAKGERLLACLGELHLEQSILDLKTRFIQPSSSSSSIELNVSDPIVAFAESCAWFDDEMGPSSSSSSSSSDDCYTSFYRNRHKFPPLRQCTIPPYDSEEGLSGACRGRARGVFGGSKAGAIHLRVVPLAMGVYESLKNGEMREGTEEDFMLLGRALNYITNDDDAAAAAWGAEDVFESLKELSCGCDDNGNAIIVSRGMMTGEAVIGVEADEVYTITKQNPMKSQTDPPPSLTAAEEGYQQAQNAILNGGIGPLPSTLPPPSSQALTLWTTSLRGSLLAGFQIATTNGPLCDEPVRSTLTIIEAIEIALPSSNNTTTTTTLHGGLLVPTLRSSIRCAILTRPVRLVEPFLKITLHSSLAGLGPLNAILSRRRGCVIADEMVDGTDLLKIQATIPQAESFGLTTELLKKSSGDVTAPELIFGGWQILRDDPFWIPTSLEEREDYGEITSSGDKSTGRGKNDALRYIRMVRGRKGLLEGEGAKIVVAAEKQRTLARKK